MVLQPNNKPRCAGTLQENSSLRIRDNLISQSVSQSLPHSYQRSTWSTLTLWSSFRAGWNLGIPLFAIDGFLLAPTPVRTHTHIHWRERDAELPPHVLAAHRATVRNELKPLIFTPGVPLGPRNSGETVPRESHVAARSADRRGCRGRTEYCSSYRTLLLLALQGALAMRSPASVCSSLLRSSRR